MTTAQNKMTKNESNLKMKKKNFLILFKIMNSNIHKNRFPTPWLTSYSRTFQGLSRTNPLKF